MPLGNYNLPTSQSAPKNRQFKGNWWSRAKVNLSGSNVDGSSNLFGEIVSDALPVVLGAISSYYLGSYKVGSEVGSLANKGLDSWSNKLLRGTSAQSVAKDAAVEGDKTRSTIDAIGGAAAGIYQAAGGATYANKPESGTRKENRMLDKALKGVSDESIADYLGDNMGGDVDLSSLTDSLSSLSKIQQGLNKNTDFDPSALDPNSSLAKFYSYSNPDFETGNGLSSYAGLQSKAGQKLNLGQNSSITGIIGNGIKMLDDKKAKKPEYDFGSSLPYSSPNGFASGGKTTPMKKRPYSLAGIKKKTPFHLV